MGRYVRGRRGTRPSVADALQQAEEDHFRDCPDAGFLIRAAACLLDLIFLFLALSTVNRLGIAAAALGYAGMESAPADGRLPALYSAFLVAVDATLAYFYTVWTVLRFGASPAKLLLNLQVIDSRTGGRLGIHQALLREWVGKLLSLAAIGAGFFLPLFRKDKRTLHDLLSHSAVKNIDEEEP